MTESDFSRRRAVLAIASLASMGAGGCVAMPGSNLPVTDWYLLDDPGLEPARAGVRASRSRLVLLIGPVSASSFDESRMLAFGKSSQTRGHYQFAGWTERPSRRIAQLVERRLDARGAFGAVAQSTSGIQGQLLLNLHLEHLYHDVSVRPGQARVAIAAELLQWTDRQLLGRKIFSAARPVRDESAAGAVPALSLSLADVLNQLSSWVEQLPTALRR